MAYNADFAPASSTPTSKLNYCPDCAEEQSEPEDDGTCPICAATLEATPPPLLTPPHSNSTLGSTASSAAGPAPLAALGSVSSTGSATSPAGPSILAAAEQMAAIRTLMPGRGDESDLALAMELSLAQASSNSSGRAASTAAVAELPRYLIEDDRCSALHEIVLEVGLQVNSRDIEGGRSSSMSNSNGNRSDSSDSSESKCDGSSQQLMPERYYFETEMAAFSPLPPPEWQALGSSTTLPLPRAPLVWGSPEEGNAPFEDEDALQGSVVVLRRGGGATFAAKALRAQAAGALAVVRLKS